MPDIREKLEKLEAHEESARKIGNVAEADAFAERIRQIRQDGGSSDEAFGKGWTPVLKGLIYCSPRCGYSCTKAAYDKAVHDARELGLKLGHGWVTRVWENCGWHYAAHKGPDEFVQVLPTRNGVFHCFCGKLINIPSFDDPDPCVAVSKTLDAIDAYLSTLQRARAEVGDFAPRLLDIFTPAPVHKTKRRR